MTARARARIREALLDLVCARGAEATTVEMVIECARVEPAEFYRHFRDRDDLYVQIFNEIAEEFDGGVYAAYDEHDNWRDGLRAAAYYAARFFRDRQRETAFGSVRMFAAGEVAQAYRERQLHRMVDLVDRGRQELDEPDSVSRGIAESVIGSIYELLVASLRKGEGTSAAIPLVPELMFVAVRPYFGLEAALEELSIPAPPDAGEPL